MIIEKKRIPFLSTLASLSLLLILMTPIIKVYFAGRYLAVTSFILLAIWFFKYEYDSISNRTTDKLSLMTNVYLFFIFLLVLFNFFNIRQGAAAIFLPVFPILVFLYLRQYDSRGYIIIGSVLLISLIATFVTTLIASNENEYIMREISHESYSDQVDYSASNGGDIWYVYAATLLFIYFFSRFKKIFMLSIPYKIIGIFVAIISLALVLLGSSGIAIFSCLTGILFSIVTSKNKTSKILFWLLTVILLFLFASEVSPLLNIIAKEIDNKYISEKLMDVAQSVNSQSFFGQVSSRTSRYEVDWGIILESWGMGVGPQYGTLYSFAVVDGHSDILGNTARYGVIWLLFVCLYFYYISKEIKINTGLQANDNSNVALNVTFILIVLLQPALSSIVVMSTFFLIIPGIDCFVNTQISKQKEISDDCIS